MATDRLGNMMNQFGWTVLVLVVMVASAFVGAGVDRGRGRGFLLGLLLGPIGVAIVAAVGRSQPAEQTAG
jgi:hypothetical protein